MKKTVFLAIPAMALLAVAGIVSAYPLLNIEEMTQEQKDLRVQALEMKQEMIQNQIAYLKGELTQEQFQERLQAHMDEMQPLREQLRESFGNGEAGAYGCKEGHRGFGRGMMWGI